MFGRFWEICLRYMNTFSLCCFFLHSNFLEIISHLSHIIASPIITNLFYLFFCTVCFFFFLFLALIVLLCLICLYFMFPPTFFYFRSIYCLFRAAKSWANIYYYIPFIFFPFHWRWKNQDRRVDFCKAICTEGERLSIVVELKLKHPILFIAVYFLGLGCLWCFWDTLLHVAEAMFLSFNSCTT